MSEKDRDYPEWLDRELFGDLEEPAAPAPAQRAAEEESARRESIPEKEDGAVRKKKKSEKTAPDAEKPAGKKAKEKSAGAGEKSGTKKSAGSKAAPKSGEKKPKEKKPGEKAAAEKESAGKTKKKKPGRAARGLLIALIVLASLALILCVAAMVGSDLITASDANLPNVYVDEIYVGGLTREQTVETLRAAGWEKTNGGTLHVKLPMDLSFDLDYLEAGVTVPVEQIAEQAYAYGHGEDRFVNLVTYIKDMLIPQDLGGYEAKIDDDYIRSAVDAAAEEFETVTAGEEYKVNEKESTLEVVKGAGQVSIDRGALAAKLHEALLAREHELEWTEITGELKMPDFAAIAATLSEEVHNAYYDPSTEQVVPESVGVEIDTVSAEKIWDKAAVMEKICIPIKIIEPEVTADELEDMLFRDQLGYCKTSLAGSSANRKSNIALACSRFDGMVLMPGQRFSYNEVVGQRTEEAGFKVAGVYNGNKVEQDIGGGICQVSSTLYNAALTANLQIDDRSCHNLLVDYLPWGLDATVSWGGPEFVFTNNREYPVKIQAAVVDNGRNVEISIWGSNVDGSHVEMQYYCWQVYDEDFRAKYGYEVQIGWGARTVRRVFDADGNYVDYPEAHSYYHLHEEEIHYPAVPDEDDYDDYEESEEVETYSEPESETITESAAEPEPAAESEADAGEEVTVG